MASDRQCVSRSWMQSIVHHKVVPSSLLPALGGPWETKQRATVWTPKATLRHDPFQLCQKTDIGYCIDTFAAVPNGKGFFRPSWVIVYWGHKTDRLTWPGVYTCVLSSDGRSRCARSSTSRRAARAGARCCSRPARTTPGSWRFATLHYIWSLLSLFSTYLLGKIYSNSQLANQNKLVCTAVWTHAKRHLKPTLRRTIMLTTLA